jgi:hypothetical protein
LTVGLIVSMSAHIYFAAMDDCDKCYQVILPLFLTTLGHSIVIINLWAAFKLLITNE